MEKLSRTDVRSFLIMIKEGKIQIRVIGKYGNEPLSPNNFDIREIKKLFEIIEPLFYPTPKIQRSPITYSIEDGSVINIFRASTQAVVMLLATLNMVREQGNLQGLELPAAKALCELQKSAVKNNYIYELGEPESKSPALTISTETSYHINEDLWAEVEFYFYGQLMDAGGSESPNIHLKTKDYGTLKISSKKEYLKDLQENILYKYYSVRALGRQNIETGEIDSSSLILLEMTKVDNEYDDQYLAQLIAKATPRWADVKDVDKWLDTIRGI